MKMSILEKSDKERAAQLEWPNGATLSEISLKCTQDDYANICKVGQRKMKRVDLGLKSSFRLCVYYY
jgi:hypothetical protein